MVLRLHAVLVSDEHLSRCFFFFVECHIESEKCTRFFWPGENSGEFGAVSKCHCSVIDQHIT
jgi:hypothetical protein